MGRIIPVPDQPRPDADLGELVVTLARRLRAARAEALEPWGLTPHQARAFATVARHCADCGPADDHELRLSALAERLHIAPRSATEVVDALEERGLVRRVPSPTDRRATNLHLTDAGRDLHGEMRRRVAVEDGPFAALDEAERTRLAALLRKALA